jgi:hypothetical protein
MSRSTNRRANRAYRRFVSDLDSQFAVSVAMLRSWLIDGRSQESLAEAWQLTDRQVRTHLVRAADALATWLASRLKSGDPLQSIRSLFSHLSSDKRRRALRLLAMAEQGSAHGPASHPDPGIPTMKMPL